MFITDVLLTIREVAEYLRISKNTVYEMIKRRELYASKVGKSYRLRQSEVTAYLRRNTMESLHMSDMEAK